MSIIREFTLYLHAGITTPEVIHANQYSQGETWIFKLLQDDGSVYVPSTGALIGVKADGHAIAGLTGTVLGDGRVSITTTQQLTAAAGDATCELTIDGGTNGSANFVIRVEKKPTDDAILSESDLSIIQEGMNSVTPVVIAETVSDWLEDNLTDPPIDPSLSISNAAADAKVTGDKITELKTAVFEESKIFETETVTPTVLDKVYMTGGQLFNASSLPNAEDYTVNCYNVQNIEYIKVKVEAQRSYGFANYPYSAGLGLSNPKGSMTAGETYLVNVSHLKYFYIVNTYPNSADAQIEVTILKPTVDSLNSDIDILNGKFQTASVTANDLEVGGIVNGTGALVENVNRARTKDYIPMQAGSVITSTIVFNVWEYDLETHEYIRDIGGWASFYTVTQDCAVKIMWNRVKSTNVFWTNDEIIESSVIPVASSLKPVAMNADDIMSVIKNGVAEVSNENMPSLTVRTIAHRGDCIKAPECTAPAYIIARKNGVFVMENDVALSSDNEFVMWHDSSLYKLGNMIDISGYEMYTDGNTFYYYDRANTNLYTYNNGYVSSSVDVTTLTRCAGSTYSVTGLPLAVLKRIDFGAYKGTQFRGTQILTFDEWVLLCKKLGAEIYVDHKVTYTNEIVTALGNIVKKYGMGNYSSWLDIGPAHITLLRSIIPDVRCGMTSHPSASRIEIYEPYNTGRGFFFDGDAKTDMTESAIQLGLNAGFEVEVWYVEYGSATEETILNTLRTAVSYGVTGITCDHYRAEDAFKYLFAEY